MSTLNYQDYVAIIDFDDDTEMFHARVINTRDVISFYGTSVSELKKEFKQSIDDYIVYCEEKGIEAGKPYSGKFVVRTSPEVHSHAIAAAAKEGISLNKWVEHAIESAAS